MRLNTEKASNPGSADGRPWSNGKLGHLHDLQRYLRRTDYPEYGPEHFKDILRALGYPIVQTSLRIRDPQDRRRFVDAPVLVAVLDCNPDHESSIRDEAITGDIPMVIETEAEEVEV